MARGYLNTVSKRKNLKGLGLGGVSTLPAANVDGSGLLGLALAFRAAAGEVNMPNTDDNPSSVKPWDHIDTDGPLTSEERCKNIEEKIKLLEDTLVKLDAVDNRRRKLIEKAVEDKDLYDRNLHDAEKDARQNDMPKRKVSVKKKSIDKQVVKKEEDETSDDKQEETINAKDEDDADLSLLDAGEDSSVEGGVEDENKKDGIEELNVKDEPAEDDDQAMSSEE